MKSKVTFVSGYWHANLGDDLFLMILCKRYPNRKFVIFVDRANQQVYSKIPNLRVITSGSGMKFVDKFLMRIFNVKLQDIYAWWFTNAYVEIGGSIFMEDHYWKKRFRQRAFNFKHTKHYYVIGSNFGPVKSATFLKSYQSFLSQSKVVFRDSTSKKQLGIANVNVAPDVVFGVNCYFNFRPQTSAQRYIVFSIINLKRRPKLTKYTQGYELKLLELAREYIKAGYAVKLFSFCDYEGDSEAIDRIYDSFSGSEQAFVQKSRHENVQKSLELLSKASRIVASRFHATIIALANQIPVLPVAYSRKTQNVLEDISPEAVKAGISIESFVNCESKRLESKFIVLKDIEINQLREQSRQQFYYLDRLYE